MTIEIERKFLVKERDWESMAEGVYYRQGYLSTNPDATVRVRIAGEQAFLTVKGKTSGISRSEYEYSIPLCEARQMLDELCCKPLIEKTRYCIRIDDLIWEVDVFAGDNEGLVLAEVELSDPQAAITLPEWIGPEVSNDPRYFNSNLIEHPYSQWQE